MLVDPNLRQGYDPMLAIIGEGDPTPQRISQGQYLINHFSFDHYLPNCCSFAGDDGDWLSGPILGKVISARGRYGEYGVCDSPEQFMQHELGKWIEASDRKFVVSFSRIQKATQSESGGWRWHKWGEYIGEHEPTCEYIYDEPEIEEVYCYHVYEDGRK